MSDWYYARGNQQQGPVPLQVIQDMARSGQLLPTDLVWRQGMPNWLPASQVSEVFSQPAAAPAAAAHAPAPTSAPSGAPSPAYAPPGANVPTQAPAGAPSPYGQPVGYYGVQQHPGQRYQQDVPNYLVQAILVTIFCCLPFGIVSIVYAAQVNSKLAVGDYAGAVEASQRAKTWAWWSFGVVVAGILAYLAFVLVFVVVAGVNA